MPEKGPQTSKKLVRIGAVLIGLAILGVFAVVGGFAFAANQESHDPFCGSCHTQPETSYLERSTSAQPVDLASYHTSQNTKCIDCHSGKGVIGRIKAELEGAGNAFKYITKTAVQPAVLNHPIGDQNCLKCHQNVTSDSYSPTQQISIPGGFEGEEDEARSRSLARVPIEMAVFEPRCWKMCFLSYRAFYECKCSKWISE